MKIDFSTVLVDIEGKALDSSPEDKTPATVSKVAIEALLATFSDETIEGAEKLKRWELASKIKNAVSLVDITVEEITLVKKLIGKAFGPTVVGQVYQLLEGGKENDTKETS